MSSKSNPFRIDDKPGEDTRLVVRSVLSFMAQSFEALEHHNDCINSGAMSGAARIIEVCVEALEEVDDDPGEVGGGVL